MFLFVLSISCSIRPNLYPVHGSYDPSAVPAKSYLLRHPQPGRLCWRAHRWSLVVSAASRVGTTFTPTVNIIARLKKKSLQLTRFVIPLSGLWRRTVTRTQRRSRRLQRWLAAWCRADRWVEGRGRPRSTAPTRTPTKTTSTSPPHLTGSRLT